LPSPKFLNLNQKDNLTKHGELRIDKCWKYDLGSHYRLICIRPEQDLIISYTGTHDDCDRWIENNRRFEPELNVIRAEGLLIEEEEVKACLDQPEPEMDYEDMLRQKIDDKMLREIFSGLCKQES